MKASGKMDIIKSQMDHIERKLDEHEGQTKLTFRPSVILQSEKRIC